mmetsp:Transcript_15500/g.34865  ORF Transcript_15500/g.34865 Transcript_15500/m.34865 type:complete len:83 (-) Transcript_15500:105-353(-)
MHCSKNCFSVLYARMVLVPESIWEKSVKIGELVTLVTRCKLAEDLLNLWDLVFNSSVNGKESTLHIFLHNIYIGRKNSPYHF